MEENTPILVQRRRPVGVAMLIVASVLWSLSGIAVKVAEMHPLAFTFWRSASAAVALALLLPLGRGRWPQPGRMAACVLLYAMNVGMLIAATSTGPAGRAILLQYTGPVFCALFARLFQGRVMGRRTRAALAVASVGIAVMILGAEGGSGAAAPTFGLLSGVAFGALILVLEKVNRRDDDGADVNPIAVVFLNNAGTAALLLPACLWLGTTWDRPQAMAIVWATGAIQLAVPYLLFQLALRRVQPVDASLLILLEPVLNPIWVASLHGEQPDAATLVGGAAILAAMVIEATKPATTAIPPVPEVPQPAAVASGS